MAYSYRWQYCDMDFLRHCLKKYSLLLEKIPSAILTEETTGTQMFVTEFLSDCIKPVSYTHLTLPTTPYV